MKAYTLLLLSSVIFIVGLNSQNEFRVLENCGSIYSDDNHLRKEILMEIENNGFANIELYGTPLNDQILILQKAIIPIVWEFPEKCSFQYHPVLIDEEKDSIGSNEEAKRIIQLLLNHEDKYLEYLYTRADYAILGNNRVKFSFDKKSAIENIGIKDSQLLESEKTDELLQIGKDSIAKAVEAILNSEVRKEEIMSNQQQLLKPLMALGVWGMERKGIYITQEELDSTKLIFEKIFFENYGERLALLKVNNKTINEPGELLLKDFLSGFLNNENKEEKEKKLIEYLKKEYGNCPKIRLEKAVFREDAGFWLSYFPQNEEKTIEYNLKVIHNKKEVYNEKKQTKEGYLNTKLPFLPKVIGDEVCFEVEILNEQKSCEKYRECFSSNCPEVNIGYSRRAQLDTISVSDEKFSRVIVKGKGYDQFGNLLEEIKKSLVPGYPTKMNGRYGNFWDNRSWKKKHVKKTCLSFDLINSISNQKIESCKIPKDTCILVGGKKDGIANPISILKKREIKNEFEIELETEFNEDFRQLPNHTKQQEYFVNIKFSDVRAVPPFQLYRIFPKKKNRTRLRTIEPIANERTRDTVFHSFNFLKTSRRWLNFSIFNEEEYTDKSGNQYFHYELEDSNGLVKTIILNLKFIEENKCLKTRTINRQIKKLHENYNPTILNAKSPETNDGNLFGMDIPNVNYKWNNGSTEGNLLNVKPGKYSITYYSCTDSITKEYTIPYWDSKIEKEVTYNPPGKDTTLGIIKFKLKKEFLPYKFSLPLRGRQWKDTLVNDTVFVVKNLSKGYHRFKVDNPETGLEEFTVKVWKCDDIYEPKAFIKSPKKRRSKDGLIRLTFPMLSLFPEYELTWDNGKKGFVNYGLKRGKHRLRIDNGFGCKTEMEFELK